MPSHKALSLARILWEGPNAFVINLTGLPSSENGGTFCADIDRAQL